MTGSACMAIPPKTCPIEVEFVLRNHTPEEVDLVVVCEAFDQKGGKLAQTDKKAALNLASRMFLVCGRARSPSSRT